MERRAWGNEPGVIFSMTFVIHADPDETQMDPLAFA